MTSILGFLFFFLCFIPNVAAAKPFLSGNDVVSGKRVKVDLKSARATVIAFVSAKCPCSANHETELKELHEQFSTNGIQFVGVHSNVDENETLTKAHFSKSQIPFPIVQDQNAKFANMLGALKTPHVFVLNSLGQQLYAGGVDDSHQLEKAKKHYLREALAAISKNKMPAIKQTRTLGCAIRR